MTSWMRRTQAGIQSAPTTPAVNTALSPDFIESKLPRFVDPNAPDARLDIESRCIYERRLPGNAYITAHVTRLQDGFYDSPSTHGDCINNVRFLALSFVFHPSQTINRFESATVTISLHDDTDQAYTDPTPGHKPIQVPPNKPKFLRFAPHVLFGGVSPETLDWNFNLTGSLGVAQTPVSASLSPSGGLKGSYKLFQMMRVQGSTRTLLARHHHEYDIEDGEVCWTMEENALQKSGLPREMTFVMLITKGDVENVVFDINIHPKVASWFGHYPIWWNNILKYRPLQKDHMDLDRELGQKFEPAIPGRGFNFANLAGTFNDFVSLPGTTYSLTDHAFANQVPIPDAKTGQNVSTQDAKAPSRRNTRRNQSHNDQTAEAAQPPARSQTVPPPSSETEKPAAPMDYHIYLHNPRTINLHATPPPNLLSPAPTPVPSRTPAPAVTVDYNSIDYNSQAQPSYNIPRPHSTAPAPTSRYQYDHQPISSPANTKMKRRSIDISNVLNSPYYDEPKPTTIATATTPQYHGTFSRSKSGSGSASTSASRSGSLRRRHSRKDLRYAPLPEEKPRGSGSGTSTSHTNTNSGSGSTSIQSRISPPRTRQIQAQPHTQNQPNTNSPKSSTSQISPKSIIVEAPSPPDPGLSGFKARLQAHVASERERMYVYRNEDQDQNQVRERNGDRESRDKERERDRDRTLPFEIKPSSYRPPREMTPSPEPSDDAGSDTTSDDGVGQREIQNQTQNQITPRPTQTQNTMPTRTISPHRRERVLYDRSYESMVIPNYSAAPVGISSPVSVNGIATPTPLPNLNPNPNPMTTLTPRRSNSGNSSPRKSNLLSTSLSNPTSYSKPTNHPTSPPPAFPPHSISSLPSPSPPPPPPAYLTTPTNTTAPLPHATATNPSSPPPPRISSPYASPKYDALRRDLVSPQSQSNIHTRPRRGSSPISNPDLIVNGDSNDNSPSNSNSNSNSQPSWGDLREEARRKQRKRLSMPGGIVGLGRGGIGSGSGGGIERQEDGGGGGGRGYEYIIEADGEWDDR